jgi:hypothetical protein
VYLWPRLADLLGQLQAAVERCQQVIAQTGCDVTVTKPLLHQRPILHTLPDQINQSANKNSQIDLNYQQNVMFVGRTILSE